MKNSIYLASLISAILFVCSCSQEKNAEEDLAQLIELRHEKEDNVNMIRERSRELSKLKLETKHQINEIERNARNEKLKLVREYKEPIDKKLIEEILELNQSEQVEMNSAMDAFRSDPKTKELSRGRDKTDELGELNRSYTEPVKTKFNDKKDTLRAEAEASINEYKSSVEDEVNSKYSETLNDLKAKLTTQEEEYKASEETYSKALEDLQALSKKINRLKELRESDVN